MVKIRVKLRNRKWLLAILLVVASLAWLWRAGDRAPATPRRLVALSESNGPVRLYARYNACLIILPDNSLWRWGYGDRAIMPALRVPEQVGQDRNWSSAAFGPRSAMAIRQDGTLWEWGPRREFDRSAQPELILPNEKWRACAVGFHFAAALREDRTLWIWGEAVDGLRSAAGDQAPPPGINHPVEIKADAQFDTISAGPLGLYATDTAGRLWWRRYSIPGARLADMTEQISGTGFTSVDAIAGLASIRGAGAADLFSSAYNIPYTVDKRAIVRKGAKSELFEIREDGALWCSPYNAVDPPSVKPEWRRFHRGTNWVSVWSGGENCYALSADNTIWFWGYDGVELPPNAGARLTTWLKSAVGMTAPSGLMRFEKFTKPTPLLQFEIRREPAPLNEKAEPMTGSAL